MVHCANAVAVPLLYRHMKRMCGALPASMLMKEDLHVVVGANCGTINARPLTALGTLKVIAMSG